MALLKSTRSKVVVAVVAIAVILLAVVFGYIAVLASGLVRGPTAPPLPGPTLSGYLNYQGLLFYDYGTYEFPYVSVVYATSNAVQIYENASIYQNPIPTHLYILNFTGNCFRCGTNASAAVDSFLTGLKDYGMTGLYANTSYISVGNLAQLKNNSILVIVSGLLPPELEANNFALMQSLMERHTSIIYVGLNFSQMFVSDSGSTPGPSPGVPSALNIELPYGKIKPGPFVFDSPTFQFTNGYEYHFVTYIGYGNGSIVAFPNTLSSWPSEQQAGNDIAKAVWQMFWLPRYSYGSAIANVSQQGSGSLGVVMNGTAIPASPTLPAALNSGYLRIVLQATPLYSGKQPAYFYIEGQPKLGSRGSVSIQPSVFPNESQVKILFNVSFRPAKPINLSTFVQFFYAQNLTAIPKLGGLEAVIHNFTGATPSFIDYRNIGLGPGKYIVMLKNFSDNTEIAGGYFEVPNYAVTLINANFTLGLFVFRIVSGGQPVDGVRYNISVDNIYAYNSSGVVQSGLIAFRLPSGASQLTGQINFTIGMLGQHVHFTAYRGTVPLAVNSEYIEIGIALLMVVIMIVFVRAPARDEFYIDVPNLPQSKKVEIKLRAAEVLGVFDKLNANYHWRYMPLSKTEVKAAVALNVRYKNIPVELTYSNIDSILDSLLVKKYIVAADELYAPTSWEEASGHDIGYLAAFKKLRIYFVTHSYTFMDLDVSDEADVVATVHGEKKYMVIYSETSKFKNIPVYPNARTYLVFLNSDGMGEFMARLYGTSSPNSEKLKMYISADYIRLVDADDIGKYIS